MSVVLKRELDHEILEVKLNRPDRFNALNEDVIGSMIDIFKGLNRDRNTRVVILTGEGRGFCSGADLRAEDSQAGSVPGTEGMSDLGYVYKYQEYLAEMILAIHDCDKPVIAAVNGAAAGGGCRSRLPAISESGQKKQVRCGLHKDWAVRMRCGFELFFASVNGFVCSHGAHADRTCN